MREPRLPDNVESEDLLGDGDGLANPVLELRLCCGSPRVQLMFISCIDFLNSSSSLEFGSITSMTEALPVSEVRANCLNLFLRSALLLLLSSLPPCCLLPGGREALASSEAVSFARW